MPEPERPPLPAAWAASPDAGRYQAILDAYYQQVTVWLGETMGKVEAGAVMAGNSLEEPTYPDPPPSPSP